MLLYVFTQKYFLKYDPTSFHFCDKRNPHSSIDVAIAPVDFTVGGEVGRHCFYHVYRLVFEKSIIWFDCDSTR